MNPHSSEHSAADFPEDDHPSSIAHTKLLESLPQLPEKAPVIHRLFCPDFSLTSTSTSHERKEFMEGLHHRIIETSLSSQEDFHSVIGELALLGASRTLLACLDTHTHFCHQPDFTVLLLEATSAMVCGELSRAEQCLKKSHHQRPEESSPIVNLVAIFLDSERYEEADEWLQSGFTLYPNEVKFWNLYYDWLLATHHGVDIASLILKKAETLQSWMGYSLLWTEKLREALEASPDQDPSRIQEDIDGHKAQALGVFYHQGERDPDFLVEYTGALGSSGAYEKIPAIIWQTREPGSQLPWKLELHGIQALLAQNKTKEAFVTLNQLLESHDPQISPDLRQSLLKLQAELQLELGQKAPVT